MLRGQALDRDGIAVPSGTSAKPRRWRKRGKTLPWRECHKNALGGPQACRHGKVCTMAHLEGLEEI